MLKNNRGILKLLLFLLALGIQNSQAQNAQGSGAGESGMGGTLLMVIAGVVILTFLYFFLKRCGFFSGKAIREMRDIPQVTATPESDSIPAEVRAALILALHLYENELHDKEDPVITMIRVSRTYSPWSSKIYGLRKLPR